MREIKFRAWDKKKKCELWLGESLIYGKPTLFRRILIRIFLGYKITNY